MHTNIQLRQSIQPRQRFLTISVLLTGFSATELQGTGMVGIYYENLLRRTEASLLDSFFERVDQIQLMTPADQQNAIRSQLMPASAYNGLAGRIILMWYEGLWVVGGTREVISSQAYIQSLMWTAAQTHPSGAKQPGFGSWSKKPV
jgi:hypothetical protein